MLSCSLRQGNSLPGAESTEGKVGSMSLRNLRGKVEKESTPTKGAEAKAAEFAAMLSAWSNKAITSIDQVQKGKILFVLTAWKVGDRIRPVESLGVDLPTLCWIGEDGEPIGGNHRATWKRLDTLIYAGDFEGASGKSKSKSKAKGQEEE